MNIEKFTNKSREALFAASQLAQSRSNSELKNIHLLYTLLNQDNGLIPSVIQKLQISSKIFAEQVNEELNRLPKISGSTPHDVHQSAEFSQMLNYAEQIAKDMKDEYLSVEHLFLAMVKCTNSSTSKIFERSNITFDKILSALQGIRGNQRVVSQDPEATFEALKKYSKDLTLLAMQDKLDPVIGRDEEIRRVIQILSRRTKNNPVLIGEPGVGKTAIAEGLARRIVNGDVPENLKNCQVAFLFFYL